MTTENNWSGTVRTEPVAIVAPSSVAELVAALADEVKYPSPVRAIGSYHSTTECAVADGGTLIDMRNLDRVLEIGADFVRAEGGACYVDVAQALAEEGKAFYVNLEIGNATLGSVATSATKDGSFPNEAGQAGAYVSAMKLVKPDGSIIAIDEANDPNEMLLARSSYGTFGIVVEVTIRIRNLADISVRHVNYTIDGFLQSLPALRARNGSIAYYIFPFADRITVQLRGPADTKARLNRWVWRARNLGVKLGMPLASRFARLLVLPSLRYGFVALVARIARWLLQTFLHAERTDPTDQITRYKHRPRLARFTFSIWAFPEDHYPDILRDYVAFCDDHYRMYRFRPDLLTVGYRVAGSRHALLSYSFDGNVMTIDPVATGGEGWNRFLDEFNAFCVTRGGKPLLNQSPRLTREQFCTAYGSRVNDFVVAQAQFDPGGRMLNEFWKNLLG